MAKGHLGDPQARRGYKLVPCASSRQTSPFACRSNDLHMEGSNQSTGGQESCAEGPGQVQQRVPMMARAGARAYKGK